MVSDCLAMPALRASGFLAAPQPPAVRLFSLSESAHANSLHSHLILCDRTDVARQAPLSVGFSRQDSWSGAHASSPVLCLSATGLNAPLKF